jgi:uncharacterized membrane protein
MNEFRIRRQFPASVLKAIEAATTRCEATHRGEIRFVVEGELNWSQLLSDMSARARAIELFSALRIWDTAENNGVLIYVLLADRRVEVVTDRGIHLHVGDHGWRAICKIIEDEFRAGRFESGAIKGIEAVSMHLQAHFPASGARPNELPDAPLVM